jgi:DNA-binding MarR family transcriptional regulator
MYIPELTYNSKHVLQLIKDHGVCTGRQLVSETGLTPEDLVEAVKLLLKNDLISASGGTYSVNEIAQAYFNVRPSNSSLTDLVLKSS